MVKTPTHDPKKVDDAPQAHSTSSFARIKVIRLKPLAVPISRWLIQVMLFLGVPSSTTKSRAYYTVKRIVYFQPQRAISKGFEHLSKVHT